MTMPDEQAEAADQMQKEQQRQLAGMDSHRANVESMTAVNHAVVKLHEAKASLRHAFAQVVPWGALVGIAWSVWAMVHWS